MKNLTLEQLETIHELNLAVTKAIKVLGATETSAKIALTFNKIDSDQWMMEQVRVNDLVNDVVISEAWGINYGNERTA